MYFEYGPHKTKVARFFNKGYYFGDYGVFSDHVSEFQYKANTQLKTLALPKFRFLQLIDNYPKIKEAIS